jgi:uncharacterized protein (DUF362 family)/Pyruvate/2-oxoacid:ferredoxin oxidoreductase delta subunit
MSVVSVKCVDSYDEDVLYTAIGQHFEAFGIPDEINKDMRVLIKPNLLSGRKPEMAVTTHHNIVSAVVRILKEYGVKNIIIADSSGGLYNEEHMRSVYNLSGLKKPDLEEYLNHDFSYKTVKTGNGFSVKSFNLITPVVEADYIINLPKLKTHAMTTMSGGVKNLFGTIPGLQKPDMHCRYPELADFVNMLCELALTASPNVTLLDAVDSMEGNGPGGGTVKHTGLTLCSKDVFALDVVASEFMGLDPKTVPHLIAAKKLGVYPEIVDFTGDTFAPCPQPFILHDAVKSPSFSNSVPSFLSKPALWVMNTMLRSFPNVDKEKCIGCGKCAESCPQHIIEVKNRKASMPRKGCISCFCCQEMCPAHAISAKRAINL